MPRNIPPFEPPARRVVSDPPSAFPENFQSLQYYSDRRHAWTHIVSGQSSKSPYSGLLFYEQGIGYSEFYDTDGWGGISFLRSHSDWRNSGPTPFPADFKGPEFTGFLFYDQAAGFAAIYDTDGSGKLIELREYPSFGAAW